MTLGEKIKQAISENGMTQKELADKSGIGLSLIAKYIHDDSEPSFFNMCCIAMVLNLSLDYLAGWRDNNGKN